MVVRAEQQSEQRFGSAARRDPGRGGVCVLRLTIAGPSERISRSAPKMKQLEATEAQLRARIAELEQQKVELADPVYIAAQARQRLGFVMPGDATYQVRLPPTAAMPSAPGGEAKAGRPISRGTRRCGTPLPMSRMEFRRRPRRGRRLHRPLPHRPVRCPAPGG
jgi:Septum formation initiator